MLIRLILTLIFVFILVVVAPKLVKVLWPFLFALLVASIVVSIANKINTFLGRLNKRIDLPSKLTTSVLNVLVLLAVLLVIYSVSAKIVKEVISLAANIQQNWASVSATYDNVLEQFTVHLQVLPPPVVQVLEDAKDSVLVFIQDLSKNIVSLTVSTTAYGITSTGTFVINLITFFLALFFISLDFGRLAEAAQKLAGDRVRDTLTMLKNSVVKAIGGYLKAQLMLATFAFLFMLVALSIYGQPYAFSIALFLGFIDLLPVMGTIAILLPWGGIELIGGDVGKGIFIILLGIVFFLVRKVVEPKVMGDQTGLHPLLILLSTYVGLQFSGVWGALLGPLILMLLISVAKSGIFANVICDLKEAHHDVSSFLRNDK